MCSSIERKVQIELVCPAGQHIITSHCCRKCRRRCKLGLIPRSVKDAKSWHHPTTCATLQRRVQVLLYYVVSRGLNSTTEFERRPTYGLSEGWEPSPRPQQSLSNIAGKHLQVLEESHVPAQGSPPLEKSTIGTMCSMAMTPTITFPSRDCMDDLPRSKDSNRELGCPQHLKTGKSGGLAEPGDHGQNRMAGEFGRRRSMRYG